ncbi:bacteriohemerythrin [Shewanella amazonensis]|uniref:Methyl-accepting chemotaxis sensory transducer n=1 Tax=Shewanella amazonensis (strain ATCC BAA-1098 / SB2B) TaxID=326297 RepID=A1S304_SHEAM|nr:bacteriohemerythrin [Shewanella amazonensis]ABL98760.1 methyl-accepting chemotaxis sensory transducer [Shewanella amazonensis SB2B]
MLFENKMFQRLGWLLLLVVLVLLLTKSLWLEAMVLLLAAVIIGTGLMGQAKALAGLESGVANLADGDLTQRFDGHVSDNYAKVAKGLRRMSEDVTRTVSGLSDTSEAMNQVARELKSVSELATLGVASQKQRTEEAAASMAQMVHTVQDISASAARVAASVDDTMGRAEHGGRLVNQAVGRINSMAEQISQSEIVIEQLAQDAASISSIIDTISQVAEQTNLLALNAAIESARAGEHGRGFAVVADEVRNLAKRTSEATVEIQQQIQALQAGSRNGVAVMHASVALAEETRGLVSQASEALTVIVTQVGEITQMSHQIAAASEHQQQVAEQINESIASISHQATENAANTNRNNLASLKLFNMSQEIGSLLHRFHVDKSRIRHENAFVSWGPSLDIGMAEVNRQHQRLITLINELHRAINEGYGLAAIKRIVQGLVDYTANHFSYEEELFARFDYPQSQDHEDEHKKLVTQVLDFQRRVGRGENVSDELMAFLKAWLINHIQGSDKQYAPYLIANGAD